MNNLVYWTDIISLWQGDITTLEVDAIVTAANPELKGCRQPGHCVDAAVFLKAGEGLFRECARLGGCHTGEAKITKGYNLPCQYVIHAVGPIYQDYSEECATKLLFYAYFNSLCLTWSSHNRDIKSIAFCCISTGLYGYPKDKAAKIAVLAVLQFLQMYVGKHQLQKIIFCVYTDQDKEFYC